VGNTIISSLSINKSFTLSQDIIDETVSLGHGTISIANLITKVKELQNAIQNMINNNPEANS
jgi:hypothetical protein